MAPTVTVDVALLFERFGSVAVPDVVDTVAVSPITVPCGVEELTCTTSEIGAVAATFRLARVQVKFPVYPTASTGHVHDPGVIDWKFVFAGIFSENVNRRAVAGPLFVTVCVNVTFDPTLTFDAEGVLVMAESA